MPWGQGTLDAYFHGSGQKLRLPMPLPTKPPGIGSTTTTTVRSLMIFACLKLSINVLGSATSWCHAGNFTQSEKTHHTDEQTYMPSNSQLVSACNWELLLPMATTTVNVKVTKVELPYSYSIETNWNTGNTMVQYYGSLRVFAGDCMNSCEHETCANIKSTGHQEFTTNKLCFSYVPRSGRLVGRQVFNLMYDVDIIRWICSTPSSDGCYNVCSINGSKYTHCKGKIQRMYICICIVTSSILYCNSW